jgi:molecular chaperone HtpG
MDAVIPGMEPPLQHQFQINLRGVIDLLSEHLYSGPDVYIRELLQNAVDAITARGDDPDYRGEVLIECHAPKGKPPAMVFTDNGVGLTADEVHKFLATIGLSSKKAADGERPTDFIGQFGIGILSCFVVSDEIVVITRSARDAAARPVEWRARADGTYTLKELDRELDPGTQVWLTAKPGSEDLFAADVVRDLARKFGGLLPYPVKVSSGRGTVVVNDGGAPWRDTYPSEKDRTKTLLAYGREVFGTNFLDAIPLRAEAGKLDGVAFVLPFAASPGAKRPHRVYLKNMFLADRADNLFPDWAFFVQAVVNANDLRPTAGRESFYEDAKLARARAAVGDCLRRYLLDLAERRPEKLERLIAVHHRAIKGLAVEDDEFYKLVIDWLPFETSLGEMTFVEFRQATDHIRYAPDVDSFRQITRVAAAQGAPVVNAGYLYDAELLAKAPDVFPELTAEAIDVTTVAQAFDDLSLDEQDAANDLLRAADAVLKSFRCVAEAKKFQPADLPALYCTNSEGRFFRSLEQSREVANPLWSGVLGNLGRRDRAAVATAQLCLNFANPLVRKLSAMPDGARRNRAVQMLYVQALLLGHHPLSATELTLLNDGLLGIIEDTVGP